MASGAVDELIDCGPLLHNPYAITDDEEPVGPTYSTQSRATSNSQGEISHTTVIMGIKEDEPQGPAHGKPFPKRPLACKLSAHAWKTIEELFRMMDSDGSNAVTRKEAHTFFKGTFSNISADAMFHEVDVDKSGAITADEFIVFWLQVRTAGYKEHEILDEIDELLRGAAWVSWQDKPSTCPACLKPFPKRPLLCKLSNPTWKKCEELFRKMDTDGSQVITREKAVQFFKGSFSNVSADEMFNQVDVDHHGAITPEEFMVFWVGVRTSGYKEKDIVDEIDELCGGAVWVDWTGSHDCNNWGHVPLNRFPKRPFLCKLSAHTWKRCEELFNKIDIGGNLEITRDKAAQFFKGSFGQMSVDEMFNSVDINNDGRINAEEFMAFWVQVRASGYKEKDILDEVDELMHGAAWVDWQAAATTSWADRQDIRTNGQSVHLPLSMFPKRPLLCKLSAQTWKKCEELFEKMDTDHTLEITRDKAAKHFKGAFSRVSADEMFNQVDVAQRGVIRAKDFMAFWASVKASGYKEKDIIDEVENLTQGSNWVNWKCQRGPCATVRTQ